MLLRGIGHSKVRLQKVLQQQTKPLAESAQHVGSLTF
jgi:hypothetical protein